MGRDQIAGLHAVRDMLEGIRLLGSMRLGTCGKGSDCWVACS